MTNTELYLYAKAKKGSGGGSSDAEQILKALIDRSITSIEIPNSVTLIGASAFYSCTSLTSIEIPNSVTTIEAGAFYSCTSLTSIEIPNSVTTIGNAAFSKCTGLTSVTIPNSVTTIGTGAFQNCTGLTNITLENGFNANNLDLSSGTYSVDTLVAILNALADRSEQSAYRLRLGSTNLAKLSNEQIAIATEKNWTLA